MNDPRNIGQRDESRSRRFTSSASGFAFAGLVAAAASVISGPVIGRALGADGKGKVATVTTAASLVVLLLGLGFPVAARKSAAGDQTTVKRTMALGARVSAYGIPAALAVAATVYWFGPRTYTGAERILVFIMFLACPLGVLRGFGAACLTATGKVSELAMLRSAPPLVLSLASVALAATGQLNIVTALLLALTVVLLEVTIAVRPVGASWKEPLPARDLLPFSVKALPGQLAETSAVRLDQLLIFPVLSAAEVGRYVVAVTISSLPTIALAAIQARDFSRIVAAPPERAIEEASAYVRRGVALALVICSVLAALAPPAVTYFYGADFAGLALTIWLLLLGSIFLAFSFSAAAALVGLGRPGSATTGWVAAVAATVALELPFARRSGIEGAAAVSVISYCASAATHAASLHRAGGRLLWPRGLGDLKAPPKVLPPREQRDSE